MSRFYKIFGRIISSELAIPLEEWGEPVLKADLVIGCGQLPEMKCDGEKIGLRLTQYNEAAVLVVDDIAKYYVDQYQIIVEPNDGIDEMTLVTFLLSAVLPLWLQLKSCFLLKGSALTFDNQQAVLLLGNSGAGKSTLLAYCCKQGAKMLSDEFCLLGYDSDLECCVVRPAYPIIKLWHDACDLLSMPPKHFLKVRPDIFRYHWDALEVYCNQALSVRHIFIYNTSNINKPIIEPELKGIDKFEQIQDFKKQAFSSKEKSTRATDQHIWTTLLKQVNACTLNRVKRKTKIDELFSVMNDSINAPAAFEGDLICEEK